MITKEKLREYLTDLLTEAQTGLSHLDRDRGFHASLSWQALCIKAGIQYSEQNDIDQLIYRIKQGN